MEQTANTAPYKKGDRVAIINGTFSGGFFVECQSAVVVRKCRGTDGQYMVSINGDTVERFVDPAAQADPAAFVQRLNTSAQS